MLWCHPVTESLRQQRRLELVEAPRILSWARTFSYVACTVRLEQTQQEEGRAELCQTHRMKTADINAA